MGVRSAGFAAAALVPSTVRAGDAALLLGPTGGWLLAAQVVPLAWLLFSRRISACYRVGYCTLYLMSVAVAWTVALVALELTPWPALGAVALALPFLLCGGLLRWGPHRAASEGPACPVGPGVRQGPPALPPRQGKG
jgi:hypothetical protein